MKNHNLFASIIRNFGIKQWNWLKFCQLWSERLYLRLNVSSIPVQIVESRGAPSSYADLKKIYGLAWWKF